VLVFLFRVSVLWYDDDVFIFMLLSKGMYVKVFRINRLCYIYLWIISNDPFMLPNLALFLSL